MSLWMTDLVLVLALLAVTELMYRAARRRRARADDGQRTQIATVQGATLGLLALILGFTMAMADGRFSTRRAVNAVSTTYLRADALPEPLRSRSRALLRTYVDARRAFYRASPDEAPATTARAQAIQGELWTHATTLMREHPDWELTSLYVGSLNEMIDLEATRALVIVSRVPRTIHVILVLIALVAVGVTGYATGLAGSRSLLSLNVVPILIGLVFVVVDDLDRSRQGLISTGDAPMQRVERQLTADPPDRVALGAP